MSSGRSTAFAMSGILISRFIGFLREMAIASAFGLSPHVDAFYAAYRIPNFFRTLLGEGGLSAAYVPVLSRTLVTGGLPASVHLSRAFFGIVLAVSGAISLLGVVFSSSILKVFAPGFSPEVHGLAAGLMQITFPFFAFLVMGAWAMGILHVHGRFFLPAIAPIFLSGAQIGFLLLLGPSFSAGPIYALAWGVLVGGGLQFLVQVPALVREGYTIRPVWKPAMAEIRRIGTLFVPVVIALGVNQLNSLVDTILASFLPQGSLANLGYASRLYTFPIGLFGASIAMVALPSLSKIATPDSAPDVRLLTRVQGWWLRILFFILPSAAFLSVFSGEVVGLVYERGAFGSREVEQVGEVLLCYAIGIPAFGSVKILVSGFHSLQDTRTPMLRAIVSTLANVVLSVAMMQFLGVRGIALATSLAGYLLVFLLVRDISRKGGGAVFDASIIWSVGKLLLACAAMVVLGALAWEGGLAWHGGDNFVIRMVRMCLLVAGMGLIYLLLTWTTGVRGGRPFLKDRLDGGSES